MNAIYDLLGEVQTGVTKAYKEKMIHDIPRAEVIDRVAYILKETEGKRVLDIGCIGPMGDAVRQKALSYDGIDVADMELDFNYHRLNLDVADRLPEVPDLEIILAGEIIEHVSNAGHLLDLMHETGVPVILTTPNAFSTNGTAFIKKGVELVNKEHVAWYSYKTLKTLVTRHKFRIVEWFWYNGKPIVAEGLVFRLEPK